MVKSSAFGGIFFALAGIALGLYLDGGHLAQLLQPTAAFIVVGGTLGALLVQFPLPLLLRATAQLRPIFFGVGDGRQQRMHVICEYAARTRRQGRLSIEAELERIDDPFFQLCVQLVVDGVTSEQMRSIVESAMYAEMAAEAMVTKVFDAAGGFAPTIGILGAVLGLIQVMQRMEEISAIGKGIAVAFVATIYGVGLANLFFLPCAGRVRILMAQRQMLREMTLEGAVGIADGLGPRAVEQRLSAYFHLDDRRTAPVARLVAS